MSHSLSFLLYWVQRHGVSLSGRAEDGTNGYGMPYTFHRFSCRAVRLPSSCRKRTTTYRRRRCLPALGSYRRGARNGQALRAVYMFSCLDPDLRWCFATVPGASHFDRSIEVSINLGPAPAGQQPFRPILSLDHQSRLP